MKIDPVKAVGDLPSGLSIVCAQNNDHEVDGFLASWIQQISFKPLMVSLSIKPGRPAYDRIKEGGVFTINIVGEHSRNYLKYFWKGYDPKESPFKIIAHQKSENGGVIINEAKSVIECKMHSFSKPGDHEIIFAEVINTYTLEDDAKSVIHIRKSGLDY